MGTLGAVIFYRAVVDVVELLLLVLTVTLGVAAFAHCLVQKPEAFRAVGTLSKGIWLAITGGGTFIAVLLYMGASLRLLILAAMIGALVYLLDVRPAIRGLTDGTGSW